MPEETRQDLQDFGFAVVELMGHRRLAGRVREAEVAGALVLRIDVPDGDGFVTQFYGGGGALFSLTPTSEDAARAVATSVGRPEPVHRWELPAPASTDPGEPADELDADEVAPCET